MSRVEPLSLDSPYWSELSHAYGGASDIPPLLKQLDALPEAKGEREPWFTLWSALAHQGDVYSASFAAVSHVVAAIARSPATVSGGYFHFPAWIEICRCRNGVRVPEELRAAYFEALRQLPMLVALASSREWDAELISGCLAAIAASKGHASIAEAALELTPEIAEEFLEGFFGR